MIMSDNTITKTVDSNEDHQPIGPWLTSGDDSIGDDAHQGLTFGDNFEPSVTTDDDHQVVTIPGVREPMADSHQYIKSLEKKLSKLKGQSSTGGEMSSKHMMSSLSAKRDAILEQLLHSTDPCLDRQSRDIEDDMHDLSSTTSSPPTLVQYIERRLFPQWQALSDEELQRLLRCDVLEKVVNNTNHNNDSTG